MNTEISDKRLDKLSLHTYIVFCSLSVLGIVYTIGVLIQNLKHRSSRTLKITSPNINVLIFFGFILSYSSIILLGFDYDQGNYSTDLQSKLVQASIWMLTISCTLVFGSQFCKTLRIYLIFSNLTVGGKVMRDEHVLGSVLLLLLVDFIFMIAWQIIDPVQCNFIFVKIDDNATEGYIKNCSSRFQTIWILISYLYKTVTFFVGLYFTSKIRKITLPPLREWCSTLVVSLSVGLLALTTLPALLYVKPTSGLKFCIVATAIWLCSTVTLSLLFIPKMILLRNELQKRDDQNVYNSRLQFGESMLKTMELRKKSSKICFCCCWSRDDEEQNADELLTNEIEGLKSLVKKKEEIIKDLTDRLITGSDQLRDYFLYGHVTSKPKSQQTHDQQLAHITLSPVSTTLPPCLRPVQCYVTNDESTSTGESDLQTQNANPHSNQDRNLQNRTNQGYTYKDQVDGDPTTRKEFTFQENCTQCKPIPKMNVWKEGQDEYLDYHDRFYNLDFYDTSDEDSCSSCSCVMQLDEHYCCYDDIHDPRNINYTKEQTQDRAFNIRAEKANSAKETFLNKPTTSKEPVNSYTNKIGLKKEDGLLLSVPGLIYNKNNDYYKTTKPSISKNNQQIPSNSRRIIKRIIPFNVSTTKIDQPSSGNIKIINNSETGSNSLTSHADSAFENDTINSSETRKSRRNRSSSTIVTKADVHNSKHLEPNQNLTYRISSNSIPSPYDSQRRTRPNNPLNLDCQEREVIRNLVDRKSLNKNVQRVIEEKTFRNNVANESQLTIASI